ncbi:unnamed protein product [Anisakis simplex]|uniref:FH2 domain-containing protein n=1 Tax=Anisakis simplex TaxID=6269 RepID=A0A0M3JQ78_ANISI|nr:unnamed protein product [Anisakis simplex]
MCNDRVDEVITSFQPKTIPKYTLESLLPEIEAAFSAETVEEVIDRLSTSESDFARKQLAVISKMVFT